MNVKAIVLDAAGTDSELARPPPSSDMVVVDVWTEVVVNAEVSIGVRLKVSIDPLVGVVAGPIVGVEPDSSIVVLVGMGDENVLSAAMTGLKCTLSASLEETLPLC